MASKKVNEVKEKERLNEEEFDLLKEYNDLSDEDKWKAVNLVRLLQGGDVLEKEKEEGKDENNKDIDSEDKVLVSKSHQHPHAEVAYRLKYLLGFADIIYQAAGFDKEVLDALDSEGLNALAYDAVLKVKEIESLLGFADKRELISNTDAILEIP